MSGPTRRQLETEIARTEAEIARLETELKAQRMKRDWLLAGLGLLAGEDEALHSDPQLGTPLGTMDQAQTVPLKRPGRKLTSKGPVALAARKAKVRMVDIAKRMGVDYNVVKAWNRRGNVPAQYRDSFADACKPAKS